MFLAGYDTKNQVLVFSYKFRYTAEEGRYGDRLAKSTLNDSSTSRCPICNVRSAKLAVQL